jgi:DNA helicase-2/ATP-dependent DNA helicase PcrA
MNPYGAINYIRKAVGYDAFLLEYGRYRGVDPEEYYAILDEMQEMSKDINSFSDWFDFIVKYSEDLKEAAGKNHKNSDAVTLATMHSVKGLEFDYVCIMNCVEGNTPHKKSQEAKSLEEERRMFYVAVTRARYGLDLHVPGILYGRKTQISRFITEMSFDISELKTGKRIVHERYGEGVITYIDEKRLSVYFDNIKSNKTLSLDYTISNGLIRLA